MALGVTPLGKLYSPLANSAVLCWPSFADMFKHAHFYHSLHGSCFEISIRPSHPGSALFLRHIHMVELQLPREMISFRLQTFLYQCIIGMILNFLFPLRWTQFGESKFVFQFGDKSNETGHFALGRSKTGWKLPPNL